MSEDQQQGEQHNQVTDAQTTGEEPAQEVQEKKPKKAAAKASAKQPEKAAISGQVIYIGPAIPDGKLKRFTVFRDGLPSHVQVLVDKIPALKTLFVPVSGLAAALEKLGKTASVERAKFNEVRKLFLKGAK